MDFNRRCIVQALMWAFLVVEPEVSIQALFQVGDRVRQADGSYGTVEAMTFERQPQAMYNVTVAGAHTYFVGARQWLVHNKCPTNYKVYVVKDSNTGEVIYVGRTKRSLPTRQTEHRSQSGRETWVLEARSTGLSEYESRYWEQTFIDKYKLENLINKRREVALKKWPEFLRILEKLQD